MTSDPQYRWTHDSQSREGGSKPWLDHIFRVSMMAIREIQIPIKIMAFSFLNNYAYWRWQKFLVPAFYTDGVGCFPDNKICHYLHWVIRSHLLNLTFAMIDVSTESKLHSTNSSVKPFDCCSLERLLSVMGSLPCLNQNQEFVECETMMLHYIVENE